MLKSPDRPEHPGPFKNIALRQQHEAQSVFLPALKMMNFIAKPMDLATNIIVKFTAIVFFQM